MTAELIPSILDVLGNEDISPFVTLGVLVLLQVGGWWFTLRKAKSASQDTALEQAMKRQGELDEVQKEVMNDLREDLEALKNELKAVKNEQDEEKNRYITLSSNYTQVLAENKKLQILLRQKSEENEGLKKVIDELNERNQELTYQLKEFMSGEEKKADA